PVDAVGHAQLRQGPAAADHGHRPRRGAGALPQREGRERVQGHIRFVWRRPTRPRLSLPTRKYTYRRTLPHIQKNDEPLFVTFNSDARWQFPSEAREIALECCVYQHRKRIWLHAVIVMPDHVHMVFTPLRDDDGLFSLPEILQNIKSVSSHRINRKL